MKPHPPLPLASVLRGISVDPGRPRLTWYGPGGERIELSGHVLDNWVTKTTNLLVEEFSAGPGTRVLLDLPPHWRAVVWAFAVWRAGACVVLPEPTDLPDLPDRPDLPDLPDPEAAAAGCDVVVTDRPHAYAAGGTEVVAVALPALARRFDGTLPPGAMDAAGAVMTYGDVLTWLPEADTSRGALQMSGRTVNHCDLLAWAAAGSSTATGTSPAAPGARVLLEPGPGGVVDVLTTALATYAGVGSLVLCAAEVGAELAADPGRRARLVESERVTS